MPTKPDTGLSRQQLIRYSRHLFLPEIGVTGQQRLRQAHAVIVGAGGLGCPAALYLASSGVGRITVFDHDQIDLGNLQRQIAYRNADIGAPKAETLCRNLRELNPEVQAEARALRADHDSLAAVLASATVVIDACDNFETRHGVNAACLAAGIPLVSGAAIRLQGQVTVFHPKQPDSPCYRCLYPEEGDAALRCADSGVLAPLVGVIGSLQAVEALKLIVGMGQPLIGRLLLVDALTLEMRQVRLPRDPGCPACGGL